MPQPRTSSRAALDLDEIWNYIAENSQTYADALVDNFYDILQALSAYPRLGRRRNDLGEDICT